MNQQELVSEKGPWILISVLKENTTEQDIERIRPDIGDLIDGWQSLGKVIWSGALSDNKTGIAIFEATETEARQLYDKYDKICRDILDYYLYSWDAMPILSFLEK